MEGFVRIRQKWDEVHKGIQRWSDHDTEYVNISIMTMNVCKIVTLNQLSKDKEKKVIKFFQSA